VSLLALSLATAATAGDLQASIARAAEHAAAQPAGVASGKIPSGYLWSGMALLAGGLAVTYYGFLHNPNGEFPSFGEASARNKKLGGAGLAVAFAGGTLLALGERSRRSPSVTIGVSRVTVSKRVIW
jgi:hypothetical protein